MAKKLGKRLTGLSESALQQMRVTIGRARELEHLLERASIMTRTPDVSFVEPLVSIPTPVSSVDQSALEVKPFDQAERDNSLAALKRSNYRIRGKGGAAELFSIKPTTLEAKMARMNIGR